MMEKIHQVIVFSFSIFLLSNFSYSDELRLNDKISLAQSKSYQEYLLSTKWQNEKVIRNVAVNKRGKTALLIGGIGLATSYVATAATGLAIASSWDYEEAPYYLIPVVGPFIQIPKTDSPYTELCILSGVVQTGFSIVLVYGLIRNKKSTKESSFQIVWAPIVSKNMNGIMLSLNF
jgi:hypothetical protein